MCVCSCSCLYCVFSLIFVFFTLPFSRLATALLPPAISLSPSLSDRGNGLKKTRDWSLEQGEIMMLSGPVVTMAGSGDLLMAVYHQVVFSFAILLTLKHFLTS